MNFALDCIFINSVDKVSVKTGNKYSMVTLKFGDSLFDVYSLVPFANNFGDKLKVTFTLDLKYKSLKVLSVA